MTNLYEKYIGHIVEIEFNDISYKHIPVITRIKDVDEQNILVGPFIPYFSEYLEKDSAMLKLRAIVEILGKDNINENLKKRGLQDITLELIINKSIIATCKPFVKK